jgi:hypothetical protein
MLLKEASEVTGQRTDKQELLLALLATTPMDGAKLSSRLVTYRTLKNRDLIGLFADGSELLTLPPPKVGRKADGALY